MANQEQIKILKQGVEVWNKWRREYPYVKIDLRDAKLNYANLGYFDLSSANLRNADLREVNLNYSDLSYSDLSSTNLSSANLSSINLSSTNLSYANLRNADLNSANLSSTDLSSANLSSTDLGSANLRNVNLGSADLSSADLSSANLRNANLKNVDLRNANLRNVDLRNANLRNTNFINSSFSKTILGLTSLEETKGLDSIIVKSPCIIDFQTIQTIPSKIRNTFLRKLGYSNHYIEYIPSLFDIKHITMFPVFLSHSWADKEFARKLYEALIDKGVQVWFDEKSMKMGDNLHESIHRGISKYDKLLLVCSKDSLNSWWVDDECEKIFEKERQYRKDKGEAYDLLIPIKVDEYIHEWNGAKKTKISNKVIGDFTDWEDPVKFEEKLNQLVRALSPEDLDITPRSLLGLD